MAAYIDIHSHILPGVDDGAQDPEESIAMLRAAERENVKRIFVTPHQKPDRRSVSREGMERRLAELTEEARRQRIEIELFGGGELLYSHDLTERLADGRACTMGHSHYILVEFFPDEEWDRVRDGLYLLGSAGYWPIVAHVERYACLHGRPDRIQELIDMGCYMQMNAGSLTGDWGFRMKRYCLGLIQRRLIHFIATDAHRSQGRRAPQLKKCAQLLEKKTDADYAERLLRKNAEYIFLDKEI